MAYFVTIPGNEDPIMATDSSLTNGCCKLFLGFLLELTSGILQLLTSAEDSYSSALDMRWGSLFLAPDLN